MGGILQHASLCLYDMFATRGGKRLSRGFGRLRGRWIVRENEVWLNTLVGKDDSNRPREMSSVRVAFAEFCIESGPQGQGAVQRGASSKMKSPRHLLLQSFL